MADILDMGILGSLQAIKKEGFFEKLVNLFATDSARIASLVGEAIESGDPSKLEEVSHSLKSASSSIGAVHVSALAHELEMLGSGGSTEGAPELYQRLEQELAAARDALRALL
mgnify:CR=1 FL=1